mgnify:CR=1 FL=1
MRTPLADFFSILLNERSVKRKGLFPYGKSPFVAPSAGRNETPPVLLLDDHLNAAVLRTPICRVVAGGRVAVPVACGREVVAHAAVPQCSSGTIGTSVREFLVRRELFL